MAGSMKNKGFVNEINVTPFVDVMLVLLIIFMVTAPMLTEGIDVALPKTQAVDKLPVGDSTVVLSLEKDGKLYLNQHLTSMDTLAAQLITTVKNQDKQLFLKADKDVPYGYVVMIMGKVKAAGITNLGIVAERLDDAEPEPVDPEPQPARTRTTPAARR